MSQYHLHHVIDTCVKKIFTQQLYYAMVLNECKFQHTTNADKVREGMIYLHHNLGLLLILQLSKMLLVTIISMKYYQNLYAMFVLINY